MRRLQAENLAAQLQREGTLLAEEALEFRLALSALALLPRLQSVSRADDIELVETRQLTE